MLLVCSVKCQRRRQGEMANLQSDHLNRNLFLITRTKKACAYKKTKTNKKRILYGRTEIQNFSLGVEKYFTSEHSERVKYFSTREEKFHISKRPCNFLFIILTPMIYQTISLFTAKGMICYVTVATVILSCVKITCYFHV